MRAHFWRLQGRGIVQNNPKHSQRNELGGNPLVEVIGAMGLSDDDGATKADIELSLQTPSEDGIQS